MRDTILKIILFTLNIVVSLVEAYFIIIKEIFGMNVLKFAFCGTVCYIGIMIVSNIICLFFKLDSDEKEEYRKYGYISHIVTFCIVTLVMSRIIVGEFDWLEMLIGSGIVIFFTMLVPTICIVGGGETDDWKPSKKEDYDIGIKTTYVEDKLGNRVGKATTYTTGEHSKTYYTDNLGNIKGEKTELGDYSVYKKH